MTSTEQHLKTINKTAQKIRTGHRIKTLTITVTETKTTLTRSYADGETLTLCTIENNIKTTKQTQKT